MENMVTMDEEAFDAYFSSERMWATLLSDGTPLALRQDGFDIPVHFEERQEYVKKVQEVRMNEFTEQVRRLIHIFLLVVMHWFIGHSAFILAAGQHDLA